MSLSADARLAMIGVNALDRVRSQTLSFTLRSQFLRTIYVQPELRLGFQFGIAALVSFFVSAWLPLVALVAGPLIYGIPHLAASFRLGLPRAGRLAPALLSIFLLTILARVIVYYAGIDLGASFYLPELVGAFAIFAVLSLHARSSILARVLAIVVFVPFLYFMGKHPLEIALIMLFAHNAVAFVYWWLCRNDREHRALVVSGFLVFVAGSIALALGAHEALFELLPQWSYFSAKYNLFTLGPEVLTMGANDVDATSRLISAFAFGQTLHYFVWLKAMPESTAEVRTTAMSFKSFFARLTGSTSYRAAGVAILGFTILPLACLAFQLSEVRIFYFALASFHGYFEVAALFFRNRDVA